MEIASSDATKLHYIPSLKNASLECALIRRQQKASTMLPGQIPPGYQAA
jgi:hypothetical protein